MELATQELEAHGGDGRAAATLSAKTHLRLGEPRLQDAQSNVASIFTQRLDVLRALPHLTYPWLESASPSSPPKKLIASSSSIS
jgi:hypothetical protein